jgi:hypothetical protein
MMFSSMKTHLSMVVLWYRVTQQSSRELEGLTTQPTRNITATLGSTSLWCVGLNGCSLLSQVNKRRQPNRKQSTCRTLGTTRLFQRYALTRRSRRVVNMRGSWMKSIRRSRRILCKRRRLRRWDGKTRIRKVKKVKTLKILKGNLTVKKEAILHRKTTRKSRRKKTGSKTVLYLSLTK